MGSRGGAGGIAAPPDGDGIFESWFTGGMADGFVIMPAYFPGAFDDFVDKVVPELQRRGLFRREYEGVTLRDHLGLARTIRTAQRKSA